MKFCLESCNIMVIFIQPVPASLVIFLQAWLYSVYVHIYNEKKFRSYIIHKDPKAHCVHGSKSWALGQKYFKTRVELFSLKKTFGRKTVKSMEQKTWVFCQIDVQEFHLRKEMVYTGNTVHGTCPPERRKIAEKTFGDATYRDA